MGRGFPLATVGASIGVESSGTLFFGSYTCLFSLHLVPIEQGIDPGSVGEQEMIKNLSEEPCCCIARRTKQQKHYFDKNT